ncbi:MAG: baseplate J/gp47 family protein [Pseudomonadota bacterium]
MLPKVNLADLTAEELAEEMVRRIPAHTPEWRNAQAGDPGRTMIDLFAWLGETLLYRANLTPRRMRMEFLNLLNLKQRPAQAANGLLALSPKTAQAAVPVTVPVPTRVTGPLPFEVTSPATVQPFEGQIFIKRKLEDEEKAGMADVLASLSEIYGVPMVDPYQTSRVFSGHDTADAAGRDLFSESQDGAVWIALFALDATPAAMFAAQAALDDQPCVLNLGFMPKIRRDDPLALPPAPLDGMSWQVTRPPLSLTDPGVSYRDLPVDADTTAGLSKEGVLRLVMPRAAQVFAPTNDLEDEVFSGVGERPPRLDDPALAARLVCWLRLKADDPAAKLPTSWMGINAVAIDQRETFSNVSLGVGTGMAGMRLPLPKGDIDPDTITVSVFEDDRGYVPWSRVTDLGGCDRDDRCYELIAETGELLFGDGLTGMTLPRRARVRLDHARAGGGTAGNLAAGTLTTIEKQGLKAHQPGALSGGVDAETLTAAEKRVGAWLHHRNRCVTEDDYKAIGAEMGLARIEVVPGFRPYQRVTDQVGVIAVMVLPDQTVRRPSNPRADRMLLDQAHAHFDERRPLGTELYVFSPEYAGLGITTAISLRDGAVREDVIKAIKDRLYTYLWPLADGGQGGSGWALGRTVSARELEVEIARIPGVRTTQGVNLFTPSEVGYIPLPESGPFGGQVLQLDPWQLPELLDVVVAIDVANPPDTLDLSGAGGSGSANGQGVGVPIVPEVC